MIRLDFTALRAEVAQAARQAFGQVENNHSDELIYAYALYSDYCAMIIVPAANSLEGLTRHAYAQKENIPSAWSRWSMGEWAYEGEGSKHFNAVHSRLNAPDAYEADNFEELRQRVSQTMIDALNDLEDEGFWGRREERDVYELVTIFCSISDSDDAEGLENISARQFNPDGVYQRFAARFAAGE